MNKPAIIVIGYNRPYSLLRLLSSISEAYYHSNNIPLVISLDFSGENETKNIAEKFKWQYGEKRIIKHQKKLGLKHHILKAGDLVNEYDAIIMLEDDLYVSPNFYKYSLQALEFYEESEKIGGISLYNHNLNVNTRLPFLKVEDGYDNYFLQFASSWGQLWTRKQWQDFKIWYEHNNHVFDEFNGLPNNVNNWPESSWLKYFNKYLVETNKYFVYPRVSLTTNFNEIGVHNPRKKNNLFQVPLLVNTNKKIYHFSTLENSRSIYDSHFEILPSILKAENEKIKDYDFDVSLNLTKTPNQIKSNYVFVFSKTFNPVLKYSLDLRPLEMNIICQVEGEGISLISKENYNQVFNNFKSYKNFSFFYRTPKIRELLYLFYEKFLNNLLRLC